MEMLMILGMIGRAMETGGRRQEADNNDEWAKSECRINEEIRMTNGFGRQITHGLRTHPAENEQQK